MEAQTKAMQDSLDETRKIIKQNESAIRASQRQARASEKMTELAKEQFYIAERAYIEIKNIELVEPLSVGKIPRIQIMFCNSGRTPAWDFFAFANVRVNNQTAAETVAAYPRDEDKIRNKKGGFLASGAEQPIEYCEEKPMPAEILEVINNRTFRFFIIGEAHYADFQGKRQVFPFVSALDTATGKFYQCDD